MGWISFASANKAQIEIEAILFGLDFVLTAGDTSGKKRKIQTP